MNQIQKITSLVQALNEHRHAYYNLNAPTITDKDYDRLFDELQKLEEETGFILSNSPTQTVGYYPVSNLTEPLPAKAGRFDLLLKQPEVVRALLYAFVL